MTQQLATEQAVDSYHYTSSDSSPSHSILLPAVTQVLKASGHKRVFDLGCGNGSIANVLTGRGFEVTGVDLSHTGIAFAQTAYPQIRLFQGSVYDDLASTYGSFPAVISLEVVEHVYSPRLYARSLYSLVNDGGIAIVSTPYHGYWKNLALALSGKMESHLQPLNDHGHIKFWSMRTLRVLLGEAGFGDIRFLRVGRLPALAKSMIAIAQRN